MSWNTYVHLSRGNRGSYGELPGSVCTLADQGWDSATMNIAHRGDCSEIFSSGDAHPDYSGMYVSSIDKGDAWRGNINLSTIHFLGLVGGANGMVTRQEIEGAQRIERTVNASDYFQGNTPAYGTRDRPLFHVPGGVADAIRFISLQPYSEKQFITSIGPPSVYSLQALKIGATTLHLAPPQMLEGVDGVQLIYNYPDGMLASSVRYTHHPASDVDLWLLDIRWECVPQREIA